MNTLSSVQGGAHPMFIRLDYREVTESAAGQFVFTERNGDECAQQADIPLASLPLWEVEKLTEAARVEARVETEERIRAEYEHKLAEQSERIGKALTAFGVERSRYFAKAENEVVHLALAIAAKVLHRESQVDPFLLRAMVKVSLEKLQSGSTVSLHVAPRDVAMWRDYVQGLTHMLELEVVEDGQVAAGGCVLRTEMGEMDFSIGTQLKDIEKAFFDLLAQRQIPG